MRTKFSGILTLLLAFVVQITFAQEKNVTGTVTDDDGLPLPGVNVILEGTSTGTQTDFDGMYSIEASEGDVLEFSYVGFQNQSIEIGTASTYDISMTAGSELDEVIVVGYGKSTQQSFTGTADVVSGEALSRKNVSTVSQALAGESAGVRVINTSGQPGTDATVNIRGIGSINGNTQPLYVVDGVPYNGNVSAINPGDIESTTILKDATATAIYGSRGANGVIVITTKQGTSGEDYIEVSTKTGFNYSGLPRYSTIESPEEYIELGWEGLYNVGRQIGVDPVQYANGRLFSAAGVRSEYNLWNVENGGELIDPETGKVRPGVTRKYNPEDWEDYGFQASNRTEANLRLGGGNEKTTYFTSVGYLKDEGYIIDSDYERITSRLNVTHEVKDWLSGSVNMGYTVSETNNNGQSDDSGSIFWFVDNIPSIYPLFLRDQEGNIVDDPIYGGPQYDYGQRRGFGGLTNSIADAHYSGSNIKRNEINASGKLEATITDWLSAETTFGAQYHNDKYYSLQNPFYGPSAGQNGSLYREHMEHFSYNFLQMLRFDKDYGDHHIDALIAHEANSWEQQYFFASKNQLVDPDGIDLNNSVNPGSNAGSYTQDYTLESYFGQANYNYLDTYFLSGTVRRDGTSRFADGHRWDTFASVGASWILSNESFLKNSSVIEYLKLKASYGTTGEQEGFVDPDGGSAYFDLGGNYYPAYTLYYNYGNINGDRALPPRSIGNPNITWEKTKQFQTGVNFRLGNYLEGTVDYYRKNTDNLLFERRLAPSSGNGILNVSDGELLNTGLEVTLKSHLIQTEKAFLDLGINGEIIKNELQAMPYDPSRQGPQILDQQTIYGRSVGHSIFDFYMRDFVGVDPADGRSLWKMNYVDANQDGIFQQNERTIANLTNFLADNPDVNPSDVAETVTKTYSQATQSYVGKSAIPDVRGAINIGAGWNGFTLNVQLLYQIGGYAYDYAYANLMHSDQVGSNNWHTDIRKRWQNPGDITDVPRLSNQQDNRANSISTRFLTKADFLSLNNVRLGYDIPERFMSAFNINRISLFVSGDNLLLFTERDGLNPSTNVNGSSDTYRYSPLSTVTAGVTVNF